MATLQDNLDEATAAYQALMTGTQVRVTVDQNGERVEFATSNAVKLFAYIQSLKAEIAAAACGTPTKQVPLQFTF